MVRTETLTVTALVESYSQAATDHGRATLAGNYRQANKAHESLASAYRELRARGELAQCAILPLLQHADAGVRLWAASHALEFAPQIGEPVLAELADAQCGILSFSASMTLKQWRDGKLSFP
jgi:hypothetical protein